ncbi:hypothetical protein AKJ09_06224 [Labilithrix luteola]|uniref:Uncharacterized protein n=1 Tax=Labilithrix luteola TaxID=1391654 RepID=A0A0K1Q197_9BACT|nr:hypothetical protein AKJ09_06224 [Labilithrix luteola]
MGAKREDLARATLSRMVRSARQSLAIRDRAREISTSGSVRV